MKNLSIPISIIIASLIIAGAIVYTQKPKLVELPKKEKVAKEVSPKKDLTKPEFTISEKDHIRGNQEAPVTIVEYSDFQCPFCQQFHQTMKQILADYPGKVRWVYKHFPLDFHSQARSAAEASECAAEQGKFWQFADGLFENQERLGENLYQELASQIGLNLEQFKDCFATRKYKDKVEANYQEGIERGVRGTPNSFVNGTTIPGALPYEKVKSIIESQLAKLK